MHVFNELKHYKADKKVQKKLESTCLHFLSGVNVSLNMSKTFGYGRLTAKVIIFPSASAVLGVTEGIQTLVMSS